VIECKYQEGAGTADEKIPYALDDMAAMRVAGVITYAGAGFSTGVLHLLQSSSFAAYCLPNSDLLRSATRAGAIDSGTWQLDHVIAQIFGMWDIVLSNKTPLASDSQLSLLDAPSSSDDGS
jgi:hypothetical protein